MRTAMVVFVVAVVPWVAEGDSLFSEKVEEEGTYISEKKQTFEEGDIITVLVRESVSADTDADTNTRKESELEADAALEDNPFLAENTPNGTGLLNPGELPNWDIDVENEHRSRGSTRRTNSITTTIACVVTKVYDNGNIDIEGEKTVQVNREDTDFYVSGTVRARDVTSQNTVESTQLANAKVQIKGKGPLWNNQRRGWFTKILDWFSPF